MLQLSLIDGSKKGVKIVYAEIEALPVTKEDLEPEFTSFVNVFGGARSSNILQSSDALEKRQSLLKRKRSFTSNPEKKNVWSREPYIPPPFSSYSQNETHLPPASTVDE